jgi:hypothetical protein
MTRKHRENQHQQTIRMVIEIAKAITAITTLLVLLTHGT